MNWSLYTLLNIPVLIINVIHKMNTISDFEIRVANELTVLTN